MIGAAFTVRSRPATEKAAAQYKANVFRSRRVPST
jgi:hypothetical protein